MNTGVATGDIDKLFAEESHALEEFLALLLREQGLLLEGKADQLLPIAQEKDRASDALGRMTLRRMQAFAEHGFGSGPERIASWLNTLAADDPRRASWKILLDLASRARALNEQNGALIRIHLHDNQLALSALAAASDRATLYGPDGQTLAGAGKRHLGSV